MFWNIFKKKETSGPPAAAPEQNAPVKTGKPEKKETIEERIERELLSLPGPMRRQMANPAVKAKFVEIAKRMERDGVDFKNAKAMKKWVKEHEAELKQENAGPKIETVRKTGEDIGRNDPCPCGSGKKYKKCCGAGK
ncbi:MAG: SEC-C domain-containing protein [Elusimicrobium sp.]|jgi:uncharacterized protein YecA (UPF0149 family)|nr:SEC-C domain-containing protein [Elusimicrobium sp.]